MYVCPACGIRIGPLNEYGIRRLFLHLLEEHPDLAGKAPWMFMTLPPSPFSW